MTRLAQLIDQRRALAAQVAGVDVEIAMELGDRDSARRALKEMKAQTEARKAMRAAGCFFHDAGALDAAKLEAEA